MDPETTHEMMHVPPLPEIVERLDTRLRTVASIVVSAVDDAGTSTPAEAEAARDLLRAGLRWLERIGDHNRHFRRIPVASDATLATRLQVGFDNATGALRSLDEKQFRRCSTLHAFDKAHGEGVVACVYSLSDVLFRAAEKASAFDREVYGKIYSKILANPPIPELHFVAETTPGDDR